MSRLWRSFIIAIAAAGSIGAARGEAPADRAVLQQRFDALAAAQKAGHDVPGYDPVERVTGAAPAIPLPTASPPAGLIEALASADAYADGRNSKALLVWHAGRLIDAHYYGATTAATPIVAKSLAKPLTAIVIGRAIALGKIPSLDTPVSRWITEWRDDPQRSKILVRNLLDMRSGLLAQGALSDPDSIMTRAYLDPHHDRALIDEYPVTSPPGTRYDYSNATAELVAPLIERATGMRYATFVSKYVLKPIGAAGGEVWIDRPGGMAHSGCCMLLPTESWLRLAVLVQGDGVWSGRRLLPKGYVAEMRSGTPQNPRYGMGIWRQGEYILRRPFDNPDRGSKGVLHSAPFIADDLAMFDGNGNQVAYIVPSRDLVIMRLGDSPPRDREWDNSFLPNLLVAAVDADTNRGR